jgi:tetratricopeptide (TPR) repeat protein
MYYLDNEIITKLHLNNPIKTTNNQQIPKALKEAIKGYYTEILYGYNRLGVTKIFEENNRLYLNSPYLKDNFNVEKNEIYYIGNNSFKVENYPNNIRFNLNKNELKGVTISRPKYTTKELALTLDQIRTPQTQLIEIFSENTFEIATRKFKELRLKYPDYNFEESLNNLGYSYFNKKQTDLSIQIFTLNCLEYSQSANAYDSLGEIYEAIGKLELAKQNYQKSLDLNPKNENAAQMIIKIDAQQKLK